MYVFTKRDDLLLLVPPHVGHAAEVVDVVVRHQPLHVRPHREVVEAPVEQRDRKSTRLNSSHMSISYAVFCLKKKKKNKKKQKRKKKKKRTTKIKKNKKKYKRHNQQQVVM